jgi:hypothetical protein
MRELDSGVAASGDGDPEDVGHLEAGAVAGWGARRSGPGADRNGIGMPEEVDLVNQELHNKINTTHLQRKAYLYVRQSTLRQVLENTESTKR